MYPELMPPDPSQSTDQTGNAEETRYQCRHVFTDGHRCGSPCLRNEDFCYFHHTSRRPIQDPAKRRRRQSRFAVRMPEDRTAIQLTLGEVLQKLANNELDPRRAGLLLYGLQIASLNLPRLPKADPKAWPEEPVDEITLDPTHGAIALPEEYVAPQAKKGSGQLLLEELERMDREEAGRKALAECSALSGTSEDRWPDEEILPRPDTLSAGTLPVVQAVAGPLSDSRSGPKSLAIKILRNKIRGGQNLPQHRSTMPNHNGHRLILAVARVEREVRTLRIGSVRRVPRRGRVIPHPRHQPMQPLQQAHMHGGEGREARRIRRRAEIGTHMVLREAGLHQFGKREGERLVIFKVCSDGELRLLTTVGCRRATREKITS